MKKNTAGFSIVNRGLPSSATILFLTSTLHIEPAQAFQNHVLAKSFWHIQGDKFSLIPTGPFTSYDVHEKTLGNSSHFSIHIVVLYGYVKSVLIPNHSGYCIHVYRLTQK